ncbi:TRAP transporter small permease [Paenibacillus sp. CGMCC 1.16610]|uniref:TRAP transporter small permease subunit n=1 Tax=Paenibacillus anseongense TaxID=2682845 RepID=A0ABW9U4K0_9BACL|nr:MULTISPECIES: TRAP transporter small permease [Paenibacillus]MBA2938991.1 TRAP transporter small permease [Paenibacillus sp. CGMCC 1.16610]MVQ34953.1 TRAP transporter small permease subunit [Paenibacillus anseongense]
MLRKAALAIDTLFENLALVALTSMTLIVFVQVVTRKLFNFVFFWSEEVTLLLMVWFSFMGFALGFREKLHIAMDSVTQHFPKRVNKVLGKIIDICIFGFGLYLVMNGWQFTELMNQSTLPATKLPTSFMYVVMPISGIMICIYSTLQLLGIQTIRHKGIEEEVQ